MIIKELSFIDLFLSLVIILLILGVVSFTKPKDNMEYNKYYVPFFSAKILFSILFVCIHVYYYVGGDTFLYFSGANFFADQIGHDPFRAIQLYFTSKQNISEIVYDSTYSYALNVSEDVFFMSKVIGLFSFITFQQYLTCSILFTVVTAIGLWRLYATLCTLYPSVYKILALGILFYPSLGIWGSGILKDPLTLCCVGLIFSSTYSIINGRKYFISIFYIALSSYFCLILKPYILYTFIPIMLLWAQGQISGKLENPVVKGVLTPLIVIVFGIGGFFAIDSVSSGAGKYSLESVQSVAEGFQSWHTYLAETRDQSGYSLGEISFTPLGILKKSPEGFFVTYYRPFIIGDVRNVATLFEALQNLVLFVLTIFVILRVGVFKFIKITFSNSNVRAFMLFAIVFGVAVGITSYNFGALSRYKIPGVPFFVAALAIIYYLGYTKVKKGYQ